MMTLCLLCFLCLGPQDLISSEQHPDWRPLQPPDLQSLESSVAKQLNDTQNELRAKLEEGDPTQCSEAYANMAEIYHAYALLDPAETCYRNALTIDPNRSSAMYLLARLELDRGNHEAALPLLQSFSMIHPEFPPVWYQLGEIALAAEKLDDAEAAYQHALSLSPEIAAAYAGLGRVALSRERWQEALDFFKKALALQPKADRLHYFLAGAYRKLGDEAQAREHFALSGKIGPAMPDPLFGRLAAMVTSERLFIAQGKTAFNAGDLSAATALFEQALAANPNSLAAHVNLGVVLAKRGENERAIELLRQALGIDPNNVMALFNLGILLAPGEEHDQALGYLERLLSHTNDLEARSTLATYYLNDQRYADALRHFQALAEAAPDQEAVLVKRAQILIHLSRYQDAAEALANDWARHPDYGNLTHLYGRFLATCPLRDLRDGVRAATLANLVVAALPTTVHLETLALAYAEQGLCDKAAEAQQRAIFAAKAEAVDIPRLRIDLSRYQRGSDCRPGDP